MNNPQKLAGLLGMARRAGRLSIGFDASVASAENGKSQLILLSTDASAKTKKECIFAGEMHGATVMILPFDKATLAEAIGMHKPVAVLAVCDSGFAKAIRPHCEITKQEEYSL